MWDQADQKFLRSMRIRASDPAPDLPRYRVEPADVEGWYRVIDAQRRFKSVVEVGPAEFADPRAAAEDIARQMNESAASS